MRGGFEIDLPQRWEILEIRDNAVIFQNTESGAQLMVLRVSGPGPTPEERKVTYLLRYFPTEERTSYIDITTNSEKSEMKEITRQVMNAIHSNGTVPEQL